VDTGKARLAFAASPVNAAAHRTGLRRKGGGNFRQRSAAFFEFVGKDRFKRLPALSEDRAIQPGFLPHVAARLGERSLRACRHVADFQVFKRDVPEPLRDGQRGFVLPVLADAGGLCRNLRNTAQRLPPSIGTAFLSSKNFLRFPLAPIQQDEVRRQGQQFAIGQRQRVRDAAINANAGKFGRGSLVLVFAGEGDMPAEGVGAYGRVQHPANALARVAEFHPTNLGEADTAPLAVEAFNLNFTALKPEIVVQALFTGSRVFGTAGEEIGESPIQIAKGLLLACLRDGGDEIELGTQRRQFTRLRNVIQLLPRLALVVSPMVAALFEREIVDKAANASERPKGAFLFWRRMELETEASHLHIADIDIGLEVCNMPENAGIRKGRHVVYALHAHLVFITKYRRDVLSELAISDLRGIFSKVCSDFGATLQECGGEDDHVHLLVTYPPTVVLPKLVNSLKGVSSRLLREWRPEVHMRGKDKALWSPSYFVGSCGGAPLAIIAEYVKSQREAPDGRSRLPPRPERRGFSRGER
jgi:putative transposase